VPRTWLERLDALASTHPDVVALRATGAEPASLTWDTLVRRSAGVARELASRGVRHGDVVCVALPNGLAHVLATHAAWRLGATVLPLRPDIPATERGHLMQLARPTVVVERTTDVEQVPAVEPAALDTAPVTDPAWMIASGGSTGTPKLVVPPGTTELLPGGFGDDGRQSPFADNRDHRHPVHVVCAPLSHTHALALLHGTLLDDFRVIVMPRFDAEELLDLVESDRVAFLALVPTMLVRLLRSPTLYSRDLSSLELVLQGAAACPDWVIEAWIDLVGPERFVMGYGSSESVAASFIRGDEWLQHRGSVGRPVGCDVVVVSDDGRPLPAGELGELYFRPTNSGGRFRYIGDASTRTLPGGFVSVGDLGWLDADGYMYIADRRTDMIVTGGSNVFVAEVEATLLAHPAVDDAVVIGLADPEWGRRVHAILQLTAGADRDAVLAELPDHCKARLAAYKVPRAFEVVVDLGRSEAGKVNRQALARAREEEAT
jgi:bile acid-coenzyme A ligase